LLIKPLSIMIFRRFAAITVSILIAGLPVAAMAQTSANSEVVITTVLESGVSQPTNAPIVTVTATAPSMAGVSNNNSPTLSFAAGFSSDTHAVTFIPGSYSVTATTNSSGYYFYYSGNCSGFTKLSGEVKACTITLSTTPPASANNCSTNPYGPGCVPPITPYQGYVGPSVLTCSPGYQTVPAGQPASFTAAGGTPGSYTWTTTDRTTLNIGNSFTTVFQSTGIQTVMVNNGVQTANCTINVAANGAAAITYPGVPSIISNYIPNYTSVGLPNTGFGPQDGAVLAFALALLIGAGIFVAPYVKQVIGITRG
jgi:hypothetical protein